jgi:hypothetical protein
MLLGDFDGTLRQSAHYPHFETTGTLQIRAEKRNPLSDLSEKVASFSWF